MQRFENLVGQKFNRLLVIEPTNRRNSNRNMIWKCECDCGNITYVATSCLKSGHTKSCGCFFNYERLAELGRKVGMKGKHYLSKTSIYRKYGNMIERCYRPKSISYNNYGGRGIKVCKEWRDKENGFINFYNWSINNGYNENLTLDRINVNGNYCPENCRWTTLEQQANNKRICVYITYNNETLTVAQWSRKLNIKPYIIYRKNKQKWTLDKIIKYCDNNLKCNSEEKNYARNM